MILTRLRIGLRELFKTDMGLVTWIFILSHAVKTVRSALLFAEKGRRRVVAECRWLMRSAIWDLRWGIKTKIAYHYLIPAF